MVLARRLRSVVRCPWGRQGSPGQEEPRGSPLCRLPPGSLLGAGQLVSQRDKARPQDGRTGDHRAPWLAASSRPACPRLRWAGRCAAGVRQVCSTCQGRRSPSSLKPALPRVQLFAVCAQGHRRSPLVISGVSDSISVLSEDSSRLGWFFGRVCGKNAKISSGEPGSALGFRGLLGSRGEHRVGRRGAFSGS